MPCSRPRAAQHPCRARTDHSLCLAVTEVAVCAAALAIASSSAAALGTTLGAAIAAFSTVAVTSFAASPLPLLLPPLRAPSLAPPGPTRRHVLVVQRAGAGAAAGVAAPAELVCAGVLQLGVGSLDRAHARTVHRGHDQRAKGAC